MFVSVALVAERHEQDPVVVTPATGVPPLIGKRDRVVDVEHEPISAATDAPVAVSFERGFPSSVPNVVECPRCPTRGATEAGPARREKVTADLAMTVTVAARAACELAPLLHA